MEVKGVCAISTVCSVSVCCVGDCERLHFFVCGVAVLGVVEGSMDVDEVSG